MFKKALACALVFCLFFAQSAAAHVLIRDESSRAGAVLHLTPGDDPVGGEPSELYFDIRGIMLSPDSIATLRITDGTGQIAEAPAEVRGNLIAAEYTFPSQDMYRLALTISTGTDTFTFNHPQRISRGTATAPIEQVTHDWAEISLVVTITAFLLLAIIAFNRRKAIAKYSRF